MRGKGSDVIAKGVRQMHSARSIPAPVVIHVHTNSTCCSCLDIKN